MFKFSKHWFLFPIFLITCSLILGFSFSKPVNAFVVGSNGTEPTKQWYSTMPSEIITINTNPTDLVMSFPIDSYLPSDELITSESSPITVEYDYYTNLDSSEDNITFRSNVFLDDRTLTLNDTTYTYYDNVVTLEGNGPSGYLYPLSLEFKYKDIILPYGYTGSQIGPGGTDQPIRYDSCLDMINSDFYSNMCIYLYKVHGSAIVRFINVSIDYVVQISNDITAGTGLHGYTNNITSYTYNWTYSSDDNYYLNPYDNTLYPIVTETDQYFKLDLLTLLRRVIDYNYEDIYHSNAAHCGRYLVYFPNISVYGFTNTFYLTSNRILAVTGSSISETGDFYNGGDYMSEDNAYSSLYIDLLDYMSYYNYVTPNLVTVEPTDMSSWLVNSVGAFVSAELFPGFAIGGILAVLIALPLAVWLLKIILGG